ncbi:hypothetical protein L1049_010511 [Liquidambar formosana]|uniref:Uncharacterized protein n=1 Tax=Liquidambar formosana TaxID=63359 RepID=A0AAP0N9G5_LIQFO
MPQELPGFYYDAEKNRYFPIKGPIPGSKRTSSSSSATAQKSVSNPNQENNICKRMRIRTAKMLHIRELDGNLITSNKGRCNFQEEYRKRQASLPMVWKYEKTDMIADGALEQINVDAHTPGGQMGTNVLLTGSMNGTLSLFEVGKVGQHFDYGVKCMPDHVWPRNIENQKESSKEPGNIWRPLGASVVMPSSVSSIKMLGKHSPHTIDDGSTIQHALITTLGSETHGGSVYVLNLVEPLDLNPHIFDLKRILHEVACFSYTIWTADCNSNGNQAVIGTNLGALLVNLENGVSSWVCRSKSDVLSQQFDRSGNIVLCGLRNGAIATVDLRQKQEECSARLTRHHIPYPAHKIFEHSSSTGRKFTKQWFEVKGNIDPSRTIFMPSSISCLVSLQFYDQYFLASSMDGSIKLFDHRIIQRGPVQSYEGHVNSHTRIQLGVDPSERFVMSGGEDCKLRLWSIKSGELLFEDKFSNSIPLTVCCTRTERISAGQDERPFYEENLYAQNHSWGAWLGSQEGLFCLHWS